MSGRFRGALKWFNEQKGYGFIKPDDGGRDVFVHITALQKSNISDIKEGEPLEYAIEERNGKACAADVVRAGGE